MTPEESVQFYEDRQAYFDKCEDFNQEVLRWFEEKYQPKVSQCNDQHRQTI